MKAVELTWTPSISAGVETQDVMIIDDNTGETYGGDQVGPTIDEFVAICPEGATVHGVVTTNRGEQNMTAISDSLTVPYGPLLPATGLQLIIAPQIARRA